MSYRRTALGFVLGAIAVTAALGLYAVLVPDFGETQGKILGSSAAVSVASVLVLACGPAWERRLLMPMPPVAAALTVAAFILLVVGMWGEVSDDNYWKTFGSLLALALWGVLTSLLVLAWLPRRYRWVFYACLGLTLMLALLGIGALWGEDPSASYGRLAGAVAVLSAAFVVAVPVLHRASRGERQRLPAAGVGFCPRCGARRPATSDGAYSCSRCGARFHVAFDE